MWFRAPLEVRSSTILRSEVVSLALCFPEGCRGCSRRSPASPAFLFLNRYFLDFSFIQERCSSPIRPRSWFAPSGGESSAATTGSSSFTS